MFKYLIVVSLFLIYAESKQKWHSSQIALNQLFDLQNEQFDAVKKYVELETKRLDELQK